MTSTTTPLIFIPLPIEASLVSYVGVAHGIPRTGPGADKGTLAQWEATLAVSKVLLQTARPSTVLSPKTGLAGNVQTLLHAAATSSEARRQDQDAIAAVYRELQSAVINANMGIVDQDGGIVND